MFSPNATIAEAKFSSTYYNDLRFQVNDSVAFFEKVVGINFCVSPIYTTLCIKFFV